MGQSTRLKWKNKVRGLIVAIAVACKACGFDGRPIHVLFFKRNSETGS